MINISGDDSNVTRVKLTEGIITAIAEDSPSEVVRIELELLTEIHNCLWKIIKVPSTFFNCFNGAVVRYMNHTRARYKRQTATGCDACPKCASHTGYGEIGQPEAGKSHAGNAGINRGTRVLHETLRSLLDSSRDGRRLCSGGKE